MSAELTDADLQAIRERLGKATEGPWVADGLGGLIGAVGTDKTVLHGVEEWREDDAEFIAHAREDVPALLAEVERLRGERENIEAGFKSFMRTFDQMADRLDKVRALHRPVDVEPSDTICAGCSTLRGSSESLRYFPTEEWPCPTIRALDGSDQ